MWNMQKHYSKKLSRISVLSILLGPKEDAKIIMLVSTFLYFGLENKSHQCEEGVHLSVFSSGGYR